MYLYICANWQSARHRLGMLNRTHMRKSLDECVFLALLMKSEDTQTCRQAWCWV